MLDPVVKPQELNRDEYFEILFMITFNCMFAMQSSLIFLWIYAKRIDNYQSLFLAKARPEPDFKYFSKDAAFNLSSKPINTSTRHGLYFFV